MLCSDEGGKQCEVLCELIDMICSILLIRPLIEKATELFSKHLLIFIVRFGARSDIARDGSEEWHTQPKAHLFLIPTLL